MTARRSHFDEVYSTKAQLARIARLTMMAELAASIAHEISDPLCAVVTSAEACLRWLNRDEPDLDEARDAVSSIASEGIRAGEMIRGLQAVAWDQRPDRRTRRAFLHLPYSYAPSYRRRS